MKVLIGSKDDCLEEFQDRIINSIGKNIMLDYDYYKDYLVNIDFNQGKVFLLSNNQVIDNAFCPNNDKYIENLLFNPIDLLVIGINVDGSIINIPNESDIASSFNDEFPGLKTIMKAKEVLLFIEGSEYEDCVKELFSGEKNNSFIASYLLDHTNITAIFDKKAARNID